MHLLKKKKCLLTKWFFNIRLEKSSFLQVFPNSPCNLTSKIQEKGTSLPFIPMPRGGGDSGFVRLMEFISLWCKLAYQRIDGFHLTSPMHVHHPLQLLIRPNISSVQRLKKQIDFIRPSVRHCHPGWCMKVHFIWSARTVWPCHLCTLCYEILTCSDSHTLTTCNALQWNRPSHLPAPTPTHVTHIP